jgi:anti-anti-sigma factor
MKIDASRENGSVVVRLGGRLDREWAEHLSHTLEDLVRDGVRWVTIDLSRVTYVSSAATKVLARWQEELALMRGEVELTSVSPALREMFVTAGWATRFDPPGGPESARSDLRQSTWYSRPGSATSGHYQTSVAVAGATLHCRLYGRPDDVTKHRLGPDDCTAVDFPAATFGVGLGAIGGSYEDCCERIGELVAVAGSVAYFPTDGARMADYLVSEGTTPPRAVLASGAICEGEFAKMVRFGTQPEAEPVPLSELATICLEAAGGKAAGIVIAGETAGLAGARLRRSPASDNGGPLRFDVPAIRQWLSFAPDRTYSVTTALVAGVAARTREGPLAGQLRPLGAMGELYGHFHAAVFSYRPLPQRTVDLGALVRGLFQNHQLRDVLHLVADDRGNTGVGESAMVRGVAWVAPISRIT